MPMLPDVTSRTRLPELMDDPALEPERHASALKGLARLNRAARSARVLWPAIAREARAAGSRGVRVLDIATGSGDLPVALVGRARRAGLSVTIDGCDVSERAVAAAAARAERAGVSREAARFLTLDVLHDELPEGYDIVMCSLFMHHLRDEQVVGLLYKMRCAAARAVLVSDLERRRDGLLLAWSASRVLTRSDVVRTDALLSVRGAYMLEEFEELVIEAGLEGAVAYRRWPCRFVLDWRRT